MGSMKEVCQKIDETLEEFFSIQQDILSEQYQLEQRLKEAFFLMSKARYSMGVKSVSSLQYNENDLVEADVQVSVEDGSFVAVQKSEQGNAKSHEESLRQRTGIDGAEKKSSTIKDQDCKETKKSTKNPINWFGILVPQSLKQCQGHFQRSTDTICTIATLKAKYAECLDRYHMLLKQKQQLLDESFEKLEIES